MGQPYFPADVSLRIEGDTDEAQGMYGEAANLLFKAMRRYDLGGESLTSMTQFVGQDGAYVAVYIARGIKIVNVVTAGGAVDQPTTNPEFPEPPPPASGVFPEMYTGVIKEGTLIGSNPAALHAFGPTQSSAAAHGLELGYQDTTKLGVAPVMAEGSNSQYGVKPGMYTGAMKRIVQCLFGLGNIKYVHEQDGVRKVLTKAIVLQYDYKWARTHGVFKAGDKNHWLIEIGGRGLLAMPLPLVEGTKAASFREHLVSIGDYDAIHCVDEFGGFPSGDVIPTGQALVDALAAGTVLQLLNYTDDLTNFYTGHAGWSPMDGWAFSESGSQIHNTCRYIKQKAAPGTGQLYWWSEHWAIELRLTPYDLTATAREEPVGFGSATLTKLRAAPLITIPAYTFRDVINTRTRNVLYVGLPGAETLLPVTFESQQGPDDFGLTVDDAWSLPDPVIRVFFEGEQLQKFYFTVKDQAAFIDPFTVTYRWVQSGGGIGYFYGDSLETNRRALQIKDHFDTLGAILGVPTTIHWVKYQSTFWSSYLALFPPSSREGYAMVTQYNTAGYLVGGYIEPPRQLGQQSSIAGTALTTDGSLPTITISVDAFVAGLGRLSFGNIYDFTGTALPLPILDVTYFGQALPAQDVYLDINRNVYRDSDYVATQQMQFDVNPNRDFTFNGSLDLAPWATPRNTNWTGPLNA